MTELTIMITENRVDAVKEIISEPPLDGYKIKPSGARHIVGCKDISSRMVQLGPWVDYSGRLVCFMESIYGIAGALDLALALYNRIPDCPWGFKFKSIYNYDCVWAVQFDGEYLACRYMEIQKNYDGEDWVCEECHKDNPENPSYNRKDIWNINTGNSSEYIRCKYCGWDWNANPTLTCEVVYQLVTGKFLRYSQSNMSEEDIRSCWEIIDSYNNKFGYLDLVLSVNGSFEEMLAILNTLKVYRVEKYIRWLQGDRDSFCFSDLRVTRAEDREVLQICEDSTEEDLRRFVCSSDSLSVIGTGQRGSFDYYENLSMFEELAEAAPRSIFSGSLTGETRVKGKLCQKGELRNGELTLSVYDDSLTLENYYFDYAKKICSPSKFRKMFEFKIDRAMSIDTCWYRFMEKYYRSEEPESFSEFQDCCEYKVSSSDEECAEDNYEVALNRFRELLTLRKAEFSEARYNNPDFWSHRSYDPITKKTEYIYRP